MHLHFQIILFSEICQVNSQQLHRLNFMMYSFLSNSSLSPSIRIICSILYYMIQSSFQEYLLIFFTLLVNPGRETDFGCIMIIRPFELEQ